MSFEIIDTKTIYQGRVFDVRLDRVRLPDGRLADLDIISHGEAVTLVPLDEEGNLWHLRQYRHPAQRDLLELPAGAIEEGETPIEGALRELREEIGMGAQHFQHIGGFFLAPGYSTEFMHVYLATGLYENPLPGDDDEFLQVEKLPVEQVYALAEQGAIQDAKSLAALLLARKHIRFGRGKNS